MATKNKYSDWLPDNIKFGRVMIEKIEDLDNILTITARPEKGENGEIFKLKFDPYVAVRNMNESYRARTFSENGGFNSSLFIVENSDWIEWLQKESLGYYSDYDLVHYAIITGADCLDVISEFPPDLIN